MDKVFSTKDYRIKKVSTVELVCEKIKSFIKDGAFQIGDRLPSENELAKMFDVNRLTVRLALQKLSTLNILETRTGSGTYVNKFNFHEYIQEATEFYMEPELLDNVCEFRKLVEIECGRLAIERGTSEELKHLKTLLDNHNRLLEECTSESPPKLLKQIAKADLDFHFQIVEMAHNKLLSYAFTVAYESIYQYVLLLNIKRKKYIEVRTRDASKMLSIHEGIYQSICDKDFEQFQKLYLTMINHQIEDVGTYE